MRWLLLVAAIPLAGCPDNSADGFPVRPGGGGPGGGELGPDARPADANALVAGRVCVIDDLRQWDTTTMCAQTGVAGLAVTIGSETATTDDAGNFMITPPPATATRVVVTGAGIIASNTPFVPAATPIRAVAPTAAHWAAVENDSGFATTSGLGVAVIALKLDGAVDPGATAAIEPVPVAVPLYDTTSATVWDPATVAGPFAKVLFHSVTPGTATVTALASDGVTLDAIGVPIVADQITFDTLDVMTTPP
jgi:hypothetical protein